MEKQRLFFALWPTAELAERMYALARSRIRRGRVIPADKLHVTLAFLGELSEEGRTAASAAGDRVRAEAFGLSLSQLGCWRRRGIAWLGPDETPERVLTLHQSLALALDAAGLPTERRPFRPHITLARRAVVAPQRLDEVLHWPVHEFHLVASVLGPGGAVYTSIGKWPLQPPQG